MLFGYINSLAVPGLFSQLWSGRTNGFVTIEGQQFKPGDRHKRLFGACFCREVRPGVLSRVGKHRPQATDTNIPKRALGAAQAKSEDLQFGFFMIDVSNVFDPEGTDRYPEEWLEFDDEVGRLRTLS